jgi:hypothetical protein
MGMSDDFEHAVCTVPPWLAQCLLAQLALNDMAPFRLTGFVPFATQIELGSTNVRVGSTIFGARNYNK